jgi:hypothetical protein
MRKALASLLVVLLSASPLLAVSTWLSEEVKNGLAVKLGESLKLIGVGADLGAAERLEGARTGIEQMMARLEAVGADAVVAGAPGFESIELPVTDERFERSIAAYGVCSLPLHQELAADDRERFYVAFGEIAVIVISAFLRDAYLAEGGTDEALKLYLTSEQMEELSYEVQADEGLRTHVNERCAEPLGVLMQ